MNGLPIIPGLAPENDPFADFREKTEQIEQEQQKEQILCVLYHRYCFHYELHRYKRVLSEYYTKCINCENKCALVCALPDGTRPIWDQLCIGCLKNKCKNIRWIENIFIQNPVVRTVRRYIRHDTLPSDVCSCNPLLCAAQSLHNSGDNIHHILPSMIIGGIDICPYPGECPNLLCEYVHYLPLMYYNNNIQKIKKKCRRSKRRRQKQAEKEKQ